MERKIISTNVLEGVGWDDWLHWRHVGLAGVMVSLVLQLALMSLMLLAMPGQKTDSSALSVIPVTPWWAECSV
jgi:Na+/glutamate symporter